ncbi:MAG: hypothetical protein WC295_02685 [Methanoregula sp.]|jgi:hypothetical protein
MRLSYIFFSGIPCGNHPAAIMLLGDLYRIDNSAIAEAKTERLTNAKIESIRTKLLAILG